MENDCLIVGKNRIAALLSKELTEATVIDYGDFGEREFCGFRRIIFTGAMGICIRCIAPFVKSKHTDPAVVCADTTGKYVVAVLSGHIGGANELAGEVARIIGGQAIITTQSDNTGMWALDTLGEKFGWETYTNRDTLNIPITTYVNGGRTALLLDIKDKGTDWLERTKSGNVDVFYRFSDIPAHKDGTPHDYKLIIAVTPFLYTCDIPVVTYVPKVLHLGFGCKKGADAVRVSEAVLYELESRGINCAAVKSVATIELKRDEPALRAVCERLLHNRHRVCNNSSVKTGVAGCSGKNEYEGLNIFSKEELQDIEVPNPSPKAFEVTGLYGVAESCAIGSSGGGTLVVEKQKCSAGEDVNVFTFAVSIERDAERLGHIEIVGAGPGDPELISVKGKRMLSEADLILYAGSLVPKELTYYAKQGAVVRSSASMDLDEQFNLMKKYYDKGKLVVRLHTGDPCIYGAIQEQMAYFDKFGMNYHITPGISSFLAAAAELRSQFTIPERVQTIILTRGEGRTAMPEKERLDLLAKSQSTMCIFLSAGVVDQVQNDLLKHYPPTTPVAACYHLTWKDQRIYRGELQNLAKIVKENNLTLTTMIVVGEAIDNREGLSRLYSHNFKHLFRK